MISISLHWIIFTWHLMKNARWKEWISSPINAHTLSPLPFSPSLTPCIHTCLVFQESKLHRYPEYLRFLLHLPATLSPRCLEADSKPPSPHLFRGVCLNAAFSERPSLSSPKAIYKIPVPPAFFIFTLFFFTAYITAHTVCVYRCTCIHTHTHNLLTACLTH